MKMRRQEIDLYLLKSLHDAQLVMNDSMILGLTVEEDYEQNILI